MAWSWAAALSVIAVLYLLQQLLNLKKNKNLPPGPKAVPILGHFHLIGKYPHQDLHRLAQKHGPIMYLRLGAIPTIVVSSPAAAELFLKTHDLIFANRPHHEVSTYLGYEQRNITFAEYGPYWRNMRKLCTLHLFSALKISQFQPMRKAELAQFVGSLKWAAEARETVDMSVRIAGFNVDVTCMMVFGKKFTDKDLDRRGFMEMMKEAMEEAVAINLGDYFPYLRRFDLQGSAQRLKKLSKIFDGFLERIIDEHVGKKCAKEKIRDFVDTLMDILESGQAGFDFDRRHVKAVLLDILIAAMTTPATAVEWALSEAIKHPEILKKAQKELEEVVGLGRMVEESHLSGLKYLNCIIKESMRLHPAVPLVSHESMEAHQVDGFNIPNKSRVLVNIWAIGRDPNAWSDPVRFYPDRFLGSNVDLRGDDFQLIPFGSGIRECPGLQLGLTITQLIVAQLIHCFDWKLPEGILPSELDMSENFGLVSTRAKHLMVIPVYRLEK